MKYKYITSIGTILIIFSISIASIVIKDKEKSELEGRTLQNLPIKKNMIKGTYKEEDYLKDLNNGKLFQSFDKYFSDNIVLRGTMVNAYTNLQGKLNKEEINEVYIGKDDYIFSKETIELTKEEEIIKSAKYFNEFSKKVNNIPIYMTPVPHKIMVYENKMPIEGYETRGNKYLDKFLENINNENIKKIDLRKSFNENEDLYYKTDHHWNSNGAYIGYQELMNVFNEDFKDVSKAKDRSEMDTKEFKNIFLGSDGRKISGARENVDDIELVLNPSLKNCKIYAEEKERKFIYEDAIFENKLNNDYLIYLRGDFPKLVTRNMKADNERKLLIIGDSMDNILLPFLAPHFKETYSYDLRKYKGDINKEIETINPDGILIIGLTNNFILGEKGPVFNFK